MIPDTPKIVFALRSESSWREWDHKVVYSFDEEIFELFIEKKKYERGKIKFRDIDD